MGNLNMLEERKPQACLTKGCYAGCHTRWPGLESHLFNAGCSHFNLPSKQMFSRILTILIFVVNFQKMNLYSLETALDSFVYYPKAKVKS